jgi:cell division septation protein DedD
MLSLWWAAWSLGLLGLGGASEGPAVELKLRSGPSLRGILCPAGEGQLSLEVPMFAEALRFDTREIASLTFQDPKWLQDPSVKPYWVFDLADGQRLHGEIAALEPEFWQLKATGLGLLRIPRSALVRAEAMGSASIVYSGPAGLVGWSQPGKDAFVAAPGALVSRSAGSSIEQRFERDDLRSILLRLAFEGRPQFRVAIGHAGGPKARAAAVTLEAWGDSLMATCLRGEALDFVELRSGLKSGSELELQIFLEDEFVEFFDGQGTPLGRIARGPERGGMFTLTCDGAHIALRQLLVRRKGSSSLELDEARLLGWDALTGEWLTAEGRLGAEQLTVIAGTSPSAAESALPGSWWFKYLDGRQLQGTLLAVEPEGLRLSLAGPGEPQLAAFSGLCQIEAPAPAQRDERLPPGVRLVGAFGELPGALEGIGEGGALLFRPTAASLAAPVDPTGIEQLIVNHVSAYYVARRRYPHRLVLECGDEFRCKVLAVEGGGVQFDSELGGQRRIDVAQVRAIEFDPEAMGGFVALTSATEEEEEEELVMGNIVVNGVRQGDPERRETSPGLDPQSLTRALTLPRKRQNRPYPHLLLTKAGDFLRCELLEVGPQEVRFLGRAAEPRCIPVEQLAGLVWLREQEPPVIPAGLVRLRLDINNQLLVRLRALVEGRIEVESQFLGDFALGLNEIQAIGFSGPEMAGCSWYAEWDPIERSSDTAVADQTTSEAPSEAASEEVSPAEPESREQPAGATGDNQAPDQKPEPATEPVTEPKTTDENQQG